MGDEAAGEGEACVGCLKIALCSEGVACVGGRSDRESRCGGTRHGVAQNRPGGFRKLEDGSGLGRDMFPGLLEKELYQGDPAESGVGAARAVEARTFLDGSDTPSASRMISTGISMRLCLQGRLCRV